MTVRGSSAGRALSGRRRPRMRRSEVRDTMLSTAVRLVHESGLTVSLDHILMDDLIAQAGVARSAAYRVWPNRQLFVNDLLLELVSHPQLSASRLEGVTLRTALEHLKARRDDMLTAEGRRSLLIRASKSAAQANFDTVIGQNFWQTDLAVVAAVASYPPDSRHELDDAVAAAARGYIEGMTSFYSVMFLPLGVEPADGITLEDIAASGSAVMEGMVLRAQTAFHDGTLGVPDLGRRRTADPFGIGAEDDWTAPVLAYTANLLAMTRAVEHYDARERDRRLERAEEIVAGLEAHTRRGPTDT